MKRSGHLSVIGAITGMLLVGCIGPDEGDHGSQAIGAATLPIIGGVGDSGDPAVVMTQTSDGQCTATLVAPTVLLTAAHCVAHSIENGNLSGRAYFGSGNGNWIAQRNIIDLFMHRQYQGGLESGYDTALMRLDSPPPAGIDPIPMNSTPLDKSYVGAQIRTVGFGANMSSPDGQTQSGYGVKRQLQHAILDVTSDFIVTGDRDRNTCQGDSGGPTFLDLDGTEYVIAVTSFGSTGCGSGADPTSKQARVDIYLDDYIREVVAAWSGPCQGGDFQCVTDGCGDFPDPDCAPCGVDRMCSTGCDKKDLDCPYSGEMGDLCGDRDDCESLRCIVSDDDPRVSYCSDDCDPNDPNACGSLECTNRADEGDVCTYPGLTPSVQGAPCSDGTDCRSGVCDDKFDICIEQCGDGFPECGDGFSCVSIGGAQACTYPRDGGGCSAGGTGGGVALLLLLAGTLLWANKRRKALFKAA